MEIFDKNGNPLDIKDIITPFWLWLVREAKVEVIDAEEFIEVHGFLKPGDNMVPVIPFTELLALYKKQANNKLYEIVKNKVEDLLQKELIAAGTSTKEYLPEEFTTISIGGCLFNPSIWPEPIRKPANIWLGRNFCEIPLSQIPFDHSAMFPTERIKNEWGEVLIFQEDCYQILTNDPDVYLKNWFCRWEQV